MPLYLQLRDLLVSRLMRGDFDQSGFPSERELEQEYKVSRTTVRHAAEDLVREGFISKQPGRETVVVPPRTRILGDSFHSVYDDLDEAHQRLETQVVSFQITTPSKDVAKMFDVDQPQEFIVVELLRLLDQEPGILSSVFIPDSPDYEITTDDFEHYVSTITIFEEKLGVKIIGASRSLEAVGCLSREAALLNVKPNQPLLMGKTLVLDDLGKPVFYAESRYRSGHYVYYIPYLPRKAGSQLSGRRVVYKEYGRSGFVWNPDMAEGRRLWNAERKPSQSD